MTTSVVPSTEAELLEQYNNDFRYTVLPVTILFGIEIVFGFFGNLLTMYVFFFRYKPCNFRYFVLGLALTDFISCLTTIPAEMVSMIYWFNYPVPPVCKIKAYFNQFTVCSEAACLMIIAVDRYRKVCHPFKWQIKQHVAKYFCIGIFIIAGFLAIPTPIFWGVHSHIVQYKERNITVTICEKDERYRHTKLPLANIAFNQSLVAVGLVGMFVLYVVITKKLILGQREIRRQRNMQPKSSATGSTMNISSGDSCSDEIGEKFSPYPDGGSRINTMQSNAGSVNRDPSSPSVNKKKAKNELLNQMERVRRKTMIMFYLTVIFIVTTIMYGVLLSVVAFGILEKIMGARKAVYFFFLRLYFVNHVINPVLYGLMDPQFRVEMRRVKAKVLQACRRITLPKTEPK